MSAFKSYPLTLRLKMQTDQEQNQMQPDSASALQKCCPHPAEVAESVLLARAVHSFHLRNGSLSQAIRNSQTLIFLNDSVVVALEEIQCRGQLFFFLIPYFILSYKILTFLSMTLDLISYFARLFLPWTFLNCSCQFTVSVDFSMLHTPNCGSYSFQFWISLLDLLKKKHYNIKWIIVKRPRR